MFDNWVEKRLNNCRGCFLSLVKFSYWSKFHFNIIIGSGVMTVFFYNRLTWNLEIGNTTVWVLPSIWRLGWVRNTKFGMNVSNKMLLNALKFQGYSFYRFWLCIIAALYRSSSQSRSEFKNFNTSLKLTVQAIVSEKICSYLLF